MQYFFIDLDGTLKTDRDFQGGSTFDLGGKKYNYILRPHALKFLAALSKHGHVLLYTLSSFRYATFFVNELGAQEIVEEIFSRERLDRLPKVPSYVLVDNDEDIAKGKAALIERNNFVLNSRIVIAPTYMGNSDDNELLQILSEIN